MSLPSFDTLMHSYVRDLYIEYFKKDHDGTSPSNYIYYNEKRKAWTNQFSKDCYTICFTMDMELLKRWKFKYPTSKGYIYARRPNDFDNLEMKILPTKVYDLKWERFKDWLLIEYDSSIEDIQDFFNTVDPEYIDRMKQLRAQTIKAEIDKVPTLPLAELSYDKTQIAHLCGMLQYDREDTIKACEFDISSVGNMPENSVFYNKRIFVPITEGKYLVLSKNPADIVWASQGNGFESCYSLNSGAGALQSSLACITQVPWFWMAYISDGSLKEYSLFRTKWKLPHMKARCWCYQTNRGWLFDRRFPESSNEFNDMFRVLCDPKLLNDVDGKERIYLVSGGSLTHKYLVGRYRAYLDSLYTSSRDDEITFRYCRFGGYSCTFEPKMRLFIHNADCDYNPSLDYRKDIVIRFNEICNEYYSSKSQMPVGSEGTTHWVDRYLERDVKSCIIFTRVAGKLGHLLIDSTHIVKNEVYPLNTIRFAGFVTEKEITNTRLLIDNARHWIKLDANDVWDCIVIREVDGDKVKVTPMYAKPNQIGELKYARFN